MEESVAMSTHWAITNAAERIVLDDQKQGETTFTVSNPTSKADRAVLDVVTGAGTDQSWFSVADPQRLVTASGSVAYLVKVAVAADAAPGPHWIQGRVYSADSAPEESSVLSGRIFVDVAAPVPAAKPRPWWIIAVAALVVLVVVGVVSWVLVRGKGEPAPAAAAKPSPAASSSPSRSAPPSPAVVPNLVSLTEKQATDALTAVGFTVGKVRHRQDPAHAGKVLEQTPAAATAASGTKVDLVVAVSLAAPAITSPANGGSFGRGSSVDVRWDQAEAWVGAWQVNTSKQTCYFYIGHEYRDCRFDGQASVTVTSRTYNASFSMSYQPLLNLGWYNTGPVRAGVAAVDDFGAAGPSATVEFRIG
jgi:PASTA domain